MLLVAIAVARVESMVPDIHDGDGQRASADVSALVVEAAHGDLPPGNDSPAPLHSMHLEHCGHCHLLVPVRAASLARAAESAPAPDVLGSATPRSVEFPPHQRPPIA